MNYRDDAMSDARDAVEHFSDEVVERLVDNGQVAIYPLNDLTDFDSYHHESHVDAEYSLSEAATLLDQLDRYEETDSGLWEGLEPRRAISVQAAYTYGNAVLSMVEDLLKEINEDETITTILETIDNLENESPDYESARDVLIKRLKDRVEQLVRGEV